MSSLIRNDSVTMIECGLYIVNQCLTSHCKPELLHLMISSNKSFYVHPDQQTLAEISDHDLLLYIYDLDLNSESNHCLSYYDFNVSINGIKIIIGKAMIRLTV